MTAPSLLGGVPWASDNLLLLSGVVFLVGIVMVNFWKEILVGILAITLIAHYFSSDGVSQEKQAPPVQVEQSPNTTSSNTTKEESSSYLEDCISLTQKPDVCAEVWAQLSGEVN